MDRFDAMNVLLAVVEEGSISAGARRLRAPLATVSRKVADLESHLRTSLLVRTSRRIELTEAGRDYVAAAKRIMDQVDEAEQTAAGEYREPRGELLFTAPVSFGQQHVLPVVLEFLKAHPLIDMRITFADRRVNLIEEQIHVALRVGELDDNNLIATRVGEVRLATFASPGYLESAGVPQTPEDLKDFDGISTVGWRFQRGGRNLFVEPRSRVVLNTEDSCVKAAIAGLGVGRALQTHVEPWLASGEVVEILQDFALPGVPVSLIYPKQGMMPLKLRAFLNYVAPRLRATLKK
jgi:DNA-binding transcriptional LysR family regulator